ncbi:hypothetical protein U9K52_01690 [Chryseobacterium sp. MHB01]|uniref:hypothetical protein n=1 Tax=unclassified Chryseobacterium TaxID=2593645 RepID=UPI002AFE1EF2|nr:hypothetical protein [Chryseobacterium sp. MHB01]MEA1847610.1 hypothetical protein [Chryseobacterium sp. MHB01]
MSIKIKFKRSEILAVTIICLIGAGWCSFLAFYDLTINSFKGLIVKVLTLGVGSLFVFKLWVYFQRLIKSFNNVTALEINDRGISSNISGHKFLKWEQISHFTLKTVQMSSGRHSKIYVHTYDPAQSIKINTDQLQIDKDELLTILSRKISRI